jgi:hypothetical protein
MVKLMKIPETTRKSFPFFKKFGIYLFIPFFLILAYIYNNSSYPKYKVTAKVALKGVSAVSAADDIKSKYLVQKVLDEIPVQASFYEASSPKKELYGDSVPVKLIFKSVKDTDRDTWLELSTTGRQLELTDDDTVSYPKFNELISGAFGKFVMVRNPGYNARVKDFLIKLNAPDRLLDQYYNDLDAEPDNRTNILTVSLLSGNPQKGSDFLNTLFKIYGKADHGERLVEKPKTEDTTVKVSDDIAMLKKRAAALKSQIAALKYEIDHPKEEPIARTEDDIKQLKIFDDIKPYVEKTVDEFVQVPYADEIDDQFLRNDIKKYNQTELDKQHLLADDEHTSDQVVAINKKLMLLQSGIAEQIADLRDDVPAANASDPQNIAGILRSKESSLAGIEKRLETDVQQKAEIKTENTVVYSKASTPKLVVLDKPQDNVEYIPVNEGLSYSLALLAGLIISFILLMARRSKKIKRRNKLFDTEKLKETVNGLFVAKQID